MKPLCLVQTWGQAIIFLGEEYTCGMNPIQCLQGTKDSLKTRAYLLLQATNLMAKGWGQVCFVDFASGSFWPPQPLVRGVDRSSPCYTKEGTRKVVSSPPLPHPVHTAARVFILRGQLRPLSTVQCGTYRTALHGKLQTTLHQVSK